MKNMTLKKALLSLGLGLGISVTAGAFSYCEYANQQANYYCSVDPNGSQCAHWASEVFFCGPDAF
ncbi:hypothetical protein SG34_009305 [Thalassomonas viridans]|uniref:Lipoprotein n=1 Tax=Thalassomonas viridans TaxID=137584 RepID=A0AAF0C930_9GAMM|nr:hypothetical protein [Thalassomonas viridans]WDE07062.1 hypothetical protein SG34_009305 [Thalassomonas viridans]